MNALSALSLSDLGFTMHSLRHGGATDMFLSVVPFANIQIRGRWASTTSCTWYIQGSRGLLAKRVLAVSTKILMKTSIRSLEKLQQF